jgi:hypothetical protein
LERQKESDRSEDIGVDGRMILKRILGKQGVCMWIDGLVVGSGKHYNEPSDSINGREFLD